MLEIINDQGVTFQPDPDTLVPVEVYNPLFNESSELFQEIIYSASAGLTEINKSFIKNGHLVEASLSVYEQPVQVFYRGSPFFAGIFRYRISEGKISFDLKVNFGTVATKVKTANLREILTLDSDFTYTTAAKFEAMMKDTCVNPANYPYTFFPVKNDKWTDTASTIAHPWMNYWDHANQKFTVLGISAALDPANTIQVPFYKVAYILQQIFNYLNFTLEGEILSDAEFNSIYIYTRRPQLGYIILPSFCYLPDQLTVGEFLKQIGDRLKLNFTYNVMNNTVTVDSPISALKVNQVEDISAYVESFQEISIADKQGYSVTLKVDESDQAMDSAEADADETIFKPLFTLLVGNAENEVELQVSTLRQHQDTDYSYPITSQFTDLVGTAANVNWPLRLLKFKGMTSVSGGKVFPQAFAYDLDEQDAAWYRFRNDSKKVIITAKVPPGMLSRFKPTSKFGFKSREGAFIRALNAKFSYGLSGTNTELITVKIECQTIVDEFETPYSIQPYAPETDTSALSGQIPYNFCYEDGSQPVESFTMIAVQKAGSIARFASLPAKAPTDRAGVGGQPGLIYATAGNSRSDFTGATLQIHGKVPKYVIASGRKLYYFVKEGDYYTAPSFSSGDGRPMLIVF